jgi:hypothetical protein
MLLSLIFFVPQLYYMSVFAYSYQIFVVRMFFLYGLIALPGCMYSLLIFSTEASFIEKLTISPFSVYSMLQTKYRLYCIFATVIALISLPCALFSVKFVEIIAALLFDMGIMFFAGFQCARLNYKKMDIKATQYYNWQGMNFNGQLIGFMIMLLPSVIVFFINRLFGENITLWIMSVIGFIFIVTNKLWLRSIALSFEKTRYRRLECFREK